MSAASDNILGALGNTFKSVLAVLQATILVRSTGIIGLVRGAPGNEAAARELDMPKDRRQYQPFLPTTTRSELRHLPGRPIPLGPKGPRGTAKASP